VSPETTQDQKPKKIGIGVGKKRQSLSERFAGDVTLSSAAAQIEESDDEGQFCSPLPLINVHPDPNNSRAIVGCLTEISEEIIAKEYEGKRIFDYIKDEKFDLSNISCIHFIDIKELMMSTGYEENEVHEKWAGILFLARSIYFNGLKQPIEVRRNKESRNTYLINYGHRRFLASRLIKAKTIRGVIANSDTKQDDLSTSMTRWVENRNKEDLTFWEDYRDIKNIREGWKQRYGRLPSNRQIAPNLGISRKAVDRITAVVKAEENDLLTEKLILAIKNGWIYREHVPVIVNRAIEENTGREGIDTLIDETMSSIGFEIIGNSTGDPTSDNIKTIKEDQPFKRTQRKISATIKIRDLDFGRRIVKALSTEFKEFGDIDINELNSISDIKALLKRLT
jgi:ParB/RepB/Spo0J family partition protein